MLTAVLAGSLIVSSIMQRIITSPIASLAAVARNVSEKEDYSTRAADAGEDAVGLLTRTFNQMLDQIQSRDQRLSESQQRYEVAVMGSSDGLWDWDLVTQKVFFSPRWKSILGCDDDETPNELSEWENRAHPEDQELTKYRVKEYLSGEVSVYEVEFCMRHKDGSYRWILSRGAAMWEAPDRKRTEEEIRVARQKFVTLINSIPGIVWEAEPSDVSMLFVSDQASTILGFPASRWLKDPKFREQHMHPEDRKRTMAEFFTEIASGKPHHLEYRFMASDGRTVWLRESISVEVKQGEPIRVHGVIGMAEMLLDTTLNTEQLNYAQTIKFSGETLMTILSDILDLSKIEAGKLNLETVSLNPAAIIGKALKIVSAAAAQKGLALASHATHDVPETLFGNPTRLRQILLNLLSNAIKYTRTGSVEVSLYAGESRDGHVSLTIDVKDTGTGISPEVEEKLFAPFTQGDCSTTRKFGGTGLGLAIFRRLLELMGGTISLTSKPDKGSTFRLTVCLATSAFPKAHTS